MNVIHKSESAKPLELFNPKRWDVVNEGANPNGIWYTINHGVERTAKNSTPEKAVKAAKARNMFAKRPYTHEGELTLNKPTKASLAIRNSDAYYWNGPYEGGWGNFDIPKFKADVATGKKEFIDWINNPEYIKAAELNKIEAQNMGLQYTPVYEKPEYIEAVGKGFLVNLKPTLNGANGQVYMSADPPGKIYLASDMDKSATDVVRHELAHSSHMASPTSGNLSKELEYLRFKNSQVFNDSKSDLTDIAGCDFYDFGSKGYPHEAVANARDLGAQYGIKVGQEYPGDLQVLDLLKTMRNNALEGFGAKFIEALRTDNPKYVWKALNGTQWSILPFIGGTALTQQRNE